MEYYVVLKENRVAIYVPKNKYQDLLNEKRCRWARTEYYLHSTKNSLSGCIYTHAYTQSFSGKTKETGALEKGRGRGEGKTYHSICFGTNWIFYHFYVSITNFKIIFF